MAAAWYSVQIERPPCFKRHRPCELSKGGSRTSGEPYTTNNKSNNRNRNSINRNSGNSSNNSSKSYSHDFVAAFML